MRDYIILAIILGAVPICLFNPYFGVLMWSWISYFNPHRYGWGFAYHFPAAIVIAIPTMAGLLLAPKLNLRLLTRETALLLLLWAWFGFTVYHAENVPVFAAHMREAEARLVMVSKILLMTFVTVLAVTSAKRLKYLILVTAFSFGARAIPATIFAFSTGGQFLIYGPPDSFIDDNTSFALAVNMTLPLLFFLAKEEEKRWLRLLLRIAFLCGVVSVIFSYSRGGILGLVLVFAAIAIKSRKKLIGVSLVLGCGLVILTLVPARWVARMGSLQAGGKDTSAMQRIVMWKFLWNFVKDYPVTGGSFGVSANYNLFRRYATEQLPGGYAPLGPHSIYFQILGEQGFVGLALFLALLAGCLSTLRKLRQHARSFPALNLKWMIPYSHAVETGFLAYMVSGAFLGLAYFDLAYEFVAFTVIMKILFKRELGIARQAEELNPLVVNLPETVVP